MMKRIAMKLRYLGTNYHGWQRQPNEVTVQEVLENALSDVCGEEIRVVGCGRTDAGVSAYQYCVSFDSATRIPLQRMPLAVNAHLPADIAVQAAVEAPAGFNAISSCVKKMYIYQIHNSRIRDPFVTPFSYPYPTPLDVSRMAEAASAFIGTHDFAAVRNVGTETKTTVRTMYNCNVHQDKDSIAIYMTADGFLYNMARTIAGTILYAAIGKLELGEIPALLKCGDRGQMGPTLPPEGLMLANLWYEGAVGELFRNQ